MKQGLKCGCRCVPKVKGVRGKLASRFCIIHKIKPAESSPAQFPVYLNVYDLTPANGYVYWAGLGIFHSGIEVHGVEYAFGAHDLPTSGVFELEPRQCPGFKFRRTIYMGTTTFGPKEVREFMELKSNNYTGDSYHLIAKNCNHFTDDVCHSLTGKGIPRWVNRMAKIGHCCNCILPETLKLTRVPKDSVLENHGEKKPPQQQTEWKGSIMEVPVASISISCQSNGCIMPWEPKPEKLVMEK